MLTASASVILSGAIEVHKQGREQQESIPESIIDDWKSQLNVLCQTINPTAKVSHT